MLYVAMPMQNLTTLGQPLLGDYLGGGGGKRIPENNCRFYNEYWVKSTIYIGPLPPITNPPEEIMFACL